MRSSDEPQLMLAVQGMPAEAREVLQALADTRGWRLRCDARDVPRVRSGEVVVATSALRLTLARGQRPRGLLLLVTAGDAEPASSAAPDGPDALLPWPCDSAKLLDELARLLAPRPIQLDAVTRSAQHRGQTVHLTPKEYRLLQALLARPGEAVARETLEAALHVWGQEFESNTLDVHMHRLRRKLPDAGIRAVRGFGYVVIAQD